MKPKQKKPSSGHRLRLAISAVQRHRQQLTVSPPSSAAHLRISSSSSVIVSPRQSPLLRSSVPRISPSLRRKVVSQSNGPSMSRSHQSAQSRSSPVIMSARQSIVPPHRVSRSDRYQYEDSVDSEIARDVWEERAKRRFIGLWGSVRKTCKKKTGSSNPAHWRLVCPGFVNEGDWDGILASWMTEKWKKRSAAGVANRKKVPGDEKGSYVRHTGGCVSFEIHRTRLESELGITLTDMEFFEKLHKKDQGKGEWCDLRAERAATKYRQIVKKKNGVDDLVGIPFDDEAWAEATYFTKKSKGYGFGLTKQAQRIFKKAKKSALKRSRVYTSTVSDEARIELEVATRVEIRMKAFEIDMKQRVQEQVQQQVQLQVQEQVQKFLAGLQNKVPV